MAFPITPIIDDFNRANEGPPPSASWGTAHGAGLKVVSNAVTANAASNSDNIGYRNDRTYQDCECYITMVDTIGNSWFEVWVRLSTPGDTTICGYAVATDQTNNTLRYFRVDNASYTELGTSEPQTISDGDSLGVSIIGNTIQAYYKVGAGAWNAIGTARVDSTYTSGYLGLNVAGSSISGDNFGGGALGPGPGADSVPVGASDAAQPITVTLSIQESG